MLLLELLVRAGTWLKKTGLGLSFLLAFASFCVLIAVEHYSPQYGRVHNILWILLGPVFRAGCYAGTIIFPNYATRGTAGVYVVPLLGADAVFLLFMALWFVGIRLTHVMRNEKQDGAAGIR